MTKLADLADKSLSLEFACGHKVIRPVAGIQADTIAEVKKRAVCRICRTRLLHLAIITKQPAHDKNDQTNCW